MRAASRSLSARGITALSVILLCAATGCAGQGDPTDVTSSSASSSQSDAFATTLSLSAADTVDIGDYGGQTNEGVQILVAIMNNEGGKVSCLDFSGCGKGVEFGVLTATLRGEPGAVAHQTIYGGDHNGFGFNFSRPGVADFAPIAADRLTLNVNNTEETSFTLPYDLPGGSMLTFDIEFEPATGNPYLGSSGTITFAVPIVALSISELVSGNVIDNGEPQFYVSASLEPFIRDDERCPLGTWHFSARDEGGLVVAEQDVKSNGVSPRASATFAALPAGIYSAEASFTPADKEFGRFLATETASISFTVEKSP
jgi:hypothetical protein